MNNSENRRWALFGPLAVALWIIGIILLNHNGPADHATGAQILAWYKSHSDAVTMGAWLFMLGYQPVYVPAPAPVAVPAATAAV